VSVIIDLLFLSAHTTISEIPIFLLAGHDTSANALAFLLFEISQRPDLQVRLREELLSLPLSTASSENSPMTQEEVSKLEKLPLLDAVLRETLRLHPPVGSTIRAAVQDDVIPVVEHYTDKQGRMHDSIPVKKGDLIPIHILIANRSKEIWGEDARQWKCVLRIPYFVFHLTDILCSPDRWLNGIPETAKAVPGIYGPLLTFINGSHACIGWRFALIEMKVILHVLLSSFNFKLGVDPSNVGKVSTGLVLRPIMNSAREKGAALPLVISRAAQD
jgi:cytochrome P450